MDIQQFSKDLKKAISDKLSKQLEGKMDTSKSHLKREFHSLSFYCVVMNRLHDIVSDSDFAGYKIDDYHNIVEAGLADKERERLMNDVNNSPNIVLFLVDKLNF